MENQPINNTSFPSESEVHTPSRTSPQASPVIIALTTLVISSVVFGSAGYYFGQQSSDKKIVITSSTPIASVLPTESPVTPLVAGKNYVAKTFTLQIPSYWEEDLSHKASPQLIEDIQFSTLGPNEQNAQGDLLPSLANISVVKSSQTESEFFELANEPSTTITVDGVLGEQKTGFGGIAGSVFITKTIFNIPGKGSYIVTLSTQDEELKETFLKDYQAVIRSMTFLK